VLVLTICSSDTFVRLFGILHIFVEVTTFKMNKICQFVLVVVFVFLSITVSFAQVNGGVSEDNHCAQIDTFKVQLLTRISQHTAPGYKLYPTQNMWTFLELETYTGRIWQVQYSMDANKRFKVSLNTTDYSVFDQDSGIVDNRYAGRFELYPTQNMYTFILLDTYNGNTWQIQWSMDEDKRGIVGLIY